MLGQNTLSQTDYRAGTLAEPVPSRAVPLMDGWLLGASLLLIGLGLLLVTSASMPLAAETQNQPFFYLIRQSIALLLGLIAAAILWRIPSQCWFRLGPGLMLMAFLLLVVVLIPGIGREVNGSARWLNAGLMNVQVSELAKLMVLIYVACYLHRHNAAMQTSLTAMLRLMLVLGAVALLLLLEPDFGVTVVLLATALGMVFIAGIKIGRFLLVQGLILGALTFLLYSSQYRRERLSSFLDPWQDPFGNGFQLTQALIAIGRGELFGVGLGASVQKLHYLPEAHTDFLFAILAEELGLVGILALLVLYAVLVWRIFIISATAERLGRYFASYLAFGIALLIALQALINIGVNLGVLPTKGLTLPLLSYGGSSMVAMCIALGLVLRIDRENRELMQPAESNPALAVRAEAAL